MPTHVNPMLALHTVDDDDDDSSGLSSSLLGDHHGGAPLLATWFIVVLFVVFCCLALATVGSWPIVVKLVDERKNRRQEQPTTVDARATASVALHSDDFDI